MNRNLSLIKISKPLRYQFILIFILVLLSTLAINDIRATTKVTYDVHRGIPFTVLVMSECTICEPVGFIFPGIVREFIPLALLLNILIINLIVIIGGKVFSYFNLGKTRDPRVH